MLNVDGNENSKKQQVQLAKKEKQHCTCRRLFCTLLCFPRLQHETSYLHVLWKKKFHYVFPFAFREILPRLEVRSWTYVRTITKFSYPWCFAVLACKSSANTQFLFLIFSFLPSSCMATQARQKRYYHTSQFLICDDFVEKPTT